MPHATLGEVPYLFVVAEQGQLDVESLLAHCNSNLAYFMVPRYIAIAQDMPMTLSQKIEKYKLRQQAEADLDAFWDRERAGVQVTR